MSKKLNQSDYKIIPVGLESGGYVGSAYATGVVDFEAGEIYCIEHGEDLANNSSIDLTNSPKFAYVFERDEYDYEQRCMVLTDIHCYTILENGKHPEECTYQKPSTYDRIKDFFLKRKRTHDHPVFCSKPIAISLIGE